MKLGALVYLVDDIAEGKEFQKLKDIGLSTCQIGCWEEYKYSDEFAECVKVAAKKFEVEITAFWCGYCAPAIFNFYDGPITMGLVPPAYRLARMSTLIKGANFAKKMGVKDIVTHVGFIPENPYDPEYLGTIPVLREIARLCKQNDQRFLFETGQETPVTLKRIIEDIGFDNVGINLDPANLLMYGKANPVDALDVFGELVMGVHAKDGEYPTNGKFLGDEKPLGQGRVNFPALVAKLKNLGYKGAITIEREISGEQQTKDIIIAKGMLEKLINEECSL
jgi:L-ribulose-5-phosphate 3-epimerase